MQPEFSASRSARSARAHPAAATFFASFWIWRDALPWRLWRRLPDARRGGAGYISHSRSPRAFRLPARERVSMAAIDKLELLAGRKAADPPSAAAPTAAAD